VSHESDIVRVGVHLGESFGEIETVTVNMIFSDPVFENTLTKFLSIWTLVIEIIADIKRMFWDRVKPRAVCCRTVVGVIPIKPDQG